MKFCTKCGAQLNDEAKFCPKCGAPTGSTVAVPKQEPESQPAQQTASAPEPALQQASPIAEQPVQQSKTTEQNTQSAGKKTSLPLILGVIAAVAVLAVMGIFAFKKLSGADKAEVMTEALTEAVQPTAETAVQTVPETVSQAVAETTTAALETEQEVTEGTFEGLWWFGKTELAITKQGSGYKAEIYVHDSAAGGYEYVMTCTANGDSLSYADGVETQIRYSTDPQDDVAKIVEYTGMRGSFTLSNTPSDDEFTLQRDSSEEPQYLIWENDTGANWPASAEYICWYSSDLHLSEFDVDLLTKEELRIARNEIYARHGRKFASQDLQDHFNGCSWYRGTVDASNFNENSLSELEKQNVKFIEAAENGTAGMQEYYFSATPYTNNGYAYGISRLEMNNGYLTVEGMINDSYQTMTFLFDGNTKYYSAGGEYDAYEIPGEDFFDTLSRMNGLGIYLDVAGGKVVAATLCS